VENPIVEAPTDEEGNPLPPNIDTPEVSISDDDNPYGVRDNDSFGPGRVLRDKRYRRNSSD
jgi:hypothetical protein